MSFLERWRPQPGAGSPVVRAAFVFLGLALAAVRPFAQKETVIDWRDLFKDFAHIIVGGFIGAGLAVYFRSATWRLWAALALLVTVVEVVCALLGMGRS